MRFQYKLRYELVVRVLFFFERRLSWNPCVDYLHRSICYMNISVECQAVNYIVFNVALFSTTSYPLNSINYL